MAMLLVPFASLAGYMLFLSRFTAWPGAFLPFFTISSLMLLLYGAAVAGWLLPGAYFVAALGLACGFAGAYFSRGGLKEYFAKLLEPGPAVFFLLSLLLWGAFGSIQYSAWDEFSHWGLSIKEIFGRNALLTADSVIACKDYPPATALFQYYLTIFTGWSEGVTCFAQAALTLSAAITLITGLPWRQWLKMAVIIFLSYVLIQTFSFSLQGVYVDHVLGYFFGAILASYFLTENRKRSNVLALMPALFILPLIKSAGVLLALLAAAIVTADLLRGIKTARQGAGKPGSLVSLGLCLLLLLAPVIAAKTWNWRINTLNLPQTLSTKVGYEEMKRPFSTAATERDRITLSNFGKALFFTRTRTTLPPFFMLLLLAGIGGFLAMRRKPQGEKFQILSATFIMLAGFLAYAVGLLFLYLYSFGGYEGPRLASFDRYMNIFFMAWTLLLAIFVLRAPAAGGFRRLPAWVRALIILAGALIVIKGTFHKTAQETVELRKTVREKAAHMLSLAAPGARIYMVWQNDTGFGPQILAYELAPHHTSIRSGSWSLGKPYYPGDVWTEDIKADTWQKMLGEFDYVLIGNADKFFWDRYGKLFEDQAKARGEYLFKVTGKSNKLRLVAVPEKT